MAKPATILDAFEAAQREGLSVEDFDALLIAEGIDPAGSDWATTPVPGLAPGAPAAPKPTPKIVPMPRLAPESGEEGEARRRSAAMDRANERAGEAKISSGTASYGEWARGPKERTFEEKVERNVSDLQAQYAREAPGYEGPKIRSDRPARLSREEIADFKPGEAAERRRSASMKTAGVGGEEAWTFGKDVLTPVVTPVVRAVAARTGWAFGKADAAGEILSEAAHDWFGLDTATSYETLDGKPVPEWIGPDEAKQEPGKYRPVYGGLYGGQRTREGKEEARKVVEDSLREDIGGFSGFVENVTKDTRGLVEGLLKVGIDVLGWQAEDTDADKAKGWRFLLEHGKEGFFAVEGMPADIVAHVSNVADDIGSGKVDTAFRFPITTAAIFFGLAKALSSGAAGALGKVSDAIGKGADALADVGMESRGLSKTADVSAGAARAATKVADVVALPGTLLAQALKDSASAIFRAVGNAMDKASEPAPLAIELKRGAQGPERPVTAGSDLTSEQAFESLADAEGAARPEMRQTLTGRAERVREKAYRPAFLEEVPEPKPPPSPYELAAGVEAARGERTVAEAGLAPFGGEAAARGMKRATAQVKAREGALGKEMTAVPAVAHGKALTKAEARRAAAEAKVAELGGVERARAVSEQVGRVNAAEARAAKVVGAPVPETTPALRRAERSLERNHEAFLDSMSQLPELAVKQIDTRIADLEGRVAERRARVEKEGGGALLTDPKAREAYTNPSARAESAAQRVEAHVAKIEELNKRLREVRKRVAAGEKVAVELPKSLADRMAAKVREIERLNASLKPGPKDILEVMNMDEVATKIPPGLVAEIRRLHKVADLIEQGGQPASLKWEIREAKGHLEAAEAKLVVERTAADRARMRASEDPATAALVPRRMVAPVAGETVPPMRGAARSTLGGPEAMPGSPRQSALEPLGRAVETILRLERQLTDLRSRKRALETTLAKHASEYGNMPPVTVPEVGRAVAGKVEAIRKIGEATASLPEDVAAMVAKTKDRAGARVAAEKARLDVLTGRAELPGPARQLEPLTEAQIEGAGKTAGKLRQAERAVKKLAATTPETHAQARIRKRTEAVERAQAKADAARAGLPEGFRAPERIDAALKRLSKARGGLKAAEKRAARIVEVPEGLRPADFERLRGELESAGYVPLNERAAKWLNDNPTRPEAQTRAGPNEVAKTSQGRTWIDKDLQSRIEWRAKAEDAMQSTGWYSFLTRQTARNVTTRSPSSIVNNGLSNILIGLITDGDATGAMSRMGEAWLLERRHDAIAAADRAVAESRGTAREIAITEAEAVREAVGPRDPREVLMMEEMSKTKVFGTSQETLLGGSTPKWEGLKNLKSFQTGTLPWNRFFEAGFHLGDVVPKAERAIRGFRWAREATEAMKPGEATTFEITPTREVTLTRTKDGVRFEGREVGLDSREAYRVFAQAGSKAAADKFFDYTDTSWWVDMLRSTPAAPVAPFLVWMNKALDNPFMFRKGLLSRLFDDVPNVRTTSPAVAGMRAKQNFQRLVNAGPYIAQSMAHASQDDDLLHAIFSYSEKEHQAMIIQALSNPGAYAVMPAGSIDFMSPTTTFLSAGWALAQGLFLSSPEELERRIREETTAHDFHLNDPEIPEALRRDLKEERDLIVMTKAGMRGTESQLLKLAGLTGSFVSEMVAAVARSEKPGEPPVGLMDVVAKSGSLFFGGGAWNVFKYLGWKYGEPGGRVRKASGRLYDESQRMAAEMPDDERERIVRMLFGKGYSYRLLKEGGMRYLDNLGDAALGGLIRFPKKELEHAVISFNLAVKEGRSEDADGYAKTVARLTADIERWTKIVNTVKLDFSEKITDLGERLKIKLLPEAKPPESESPVDAPSDEEKALAEEIRVENVRAEAAWAAYEERMRRSDDAARVRREAMEKAK